MRKVMLALAASLLLVVGAYAQTTSGTITADETWSGTVTLTGDVIVTGGTLTISPGTIVKFATSNDNIVEGGSNTIFLLIMGNGVLKAVGTADNRIKFTSTSLLPSPGAYGGMRFKALTHANCEVRYCDIEYAVNGININDGLDDATAILSEVIVDNCLITKTQYSGIYGWIRAAAIISNCVLHNTSTSIFIHNGAKARITNTIIYNVPTAIVLTNSEYQAESFLIDHVTFYNVDMIMATTPTFWTGYGIFFANTPGNVTVTNTIGVQATLGCMTLGGWNLTNDYNCWSTGLLGLLTLEGPTLGAHSMDNTVANTDPRYIDDPQFVDATNADFRLCNTSPCLNAGNDGKNMGAYDGPGIACTGIADCNIVKKGKSVYFPNPVMEGANITFTPASLAVLKVFDVNGQPVASLSGVNTDRIKWENTVDPGMYFYVLQLDGTSHSGRIVVAR